jgi:NADPH-dependent ferric siderophore reductase
VTLSPHRSSEELAARLGVNALICEVVASHQLSSSVHEIVLAGSAATLAGVPGNDVMIRVASGPGSFVRRRYSVRDVDAERDQFTLWVSTAHTGPGSTWAQSAALGDHVDVVGPRGKIHLSAQADWHLFVGDVTGLAAFYRMAQSIEAPGRAIFIVETNESDDALTAPFDEGIGITGIFVDRDGRSGNDPTGLLRGLAAFALPLDQGHAYLFGEFAVTKVLRDALLDRGLDDTSISRKAFWRYGQSNAERGEPDKSES